MVVFSRFTAIFPKMATWLSDPVPYCNPRILSHTRTMAIVSSPS